ncbi:Crp/Fnr family transcriptional regulator [Saccharopolyspora sp. NFXS83]|uniref:Crp/Fnr family transcriptional regulator n=1 Tax=Saccharopolyspora sp. NFXS83 TaxID=2993560 RepID=UPI00224AC101|nr:Crp/Fnr family transcriptional regulator [Saccharopolyspora sp. NFXS83]MCX2734014.1 Crp/Fnr family transcriptional regulator [Saccharopolyspora sp. NFXS83]
MSERWSAEAVAAFRSVSRRRRWRASAVLFSVGDESDHVLLIRSGRVKVWSMSVRGTEAMLAIRGPGSMIGDFAAVDGEPRGATVTALEQVEADVVSGGDFRRFLHEHPDAMFELLTRVVARLRESDRHRVEFASSGVAERLARLLLELAREHGIPDGAGRRAIAIPLSQAELASATSASREAVARALRELRECGAVSTQRRQIVVLRGDVLAEYAAR